MRYFVVSKLSSTVIYNLFQYLADGKAVHVGAITVKGGAGIAREGRGEELVTDPAEGTEITEEQVALLNLDHTFQLHQKNGFVTILPQMDLPDMEKAALELTGEKEKSAPLDPTTLENEAAAAEKAEGNPVTIVDSNKVESKKKK